MAKIASFKWWEDGRHPHFLELGIVDLLHTPNNNIYGIFYLLIKDKYLSTDLLQ